MDSQSLLSLFDSYWFHRQILKTQPYPPTSGQNPPHQTLTPPYPTTPAIPTASMDDLISSTSTSSGSSITSFSPNSVLPSRPLQTIFSGEEMKEPPLPEHEFKISRSGKKPAKTETRRRRNSGFSHERKTRRLKLGASKSLSDLEFDEIKGFMELGFVFSEQDKRSEFLATILPGLQRLGVGDEEAKVEFDVSRANLADAWVRRREDPPLMMSWEEVRSVNSDIDMKDYLKDWAHTVASSVK